MMKEKRTASQFRGVWAHSPCERTLARVNASFKRFDVESFNDLAENALPGRLIKAVVTARFVSAVLLSAHRAQRAFGVPAALLIAIALEETHGKPLYGRKAENWFMNRGKDLAARAAEQPRDSYLRMLFTVHDPETFLHSLMACDAFSADVRERMVQTIKDCHLLECNVLTDTPPDTLWRDACKGVSK